MKPRILPGALVAVLTLTVNDPVVGAQPDGVALLLHRLEQAVERGTPSGITSLLADSADREAAAKFRAREIAPGITHAVIQERDRQALPGTLPGNGYRLLVDIFEQSGDRARIATWQLDVKRAGEARPNSWLIDGVERISSVESLYRLFLNPSKQFTVKDLTITTDDLDLTLADGSVFVADIDRGVAAMVFVGRGQMSFHPPSETERGQVKIFSGAQSLDTRFDALYLRFSPSAFETLIATDHLAARPVDPREFRRADDVFREESPKSFALELGDLARDVWSMLPAFGDILAEIHTRRFDTLTYVRSAAEKEDISLFYRKRQRNIAVYSSPRKLAALGVGYNEEQPEYDVIDYDIDLAVSPDRQWLDGRAKLKLRVLANGINTVTLKLAAPLVVQSIVSREFGWLFGARFKNQDSLIVNLPATILRDTELSLTITYAGRLEPQAPDRETAPTQRRNSLPSDFADVAAEPSFLYSSGTSWYPQPNGTDYATATMRIAVPAGMDCVASGEPAQGSPTSIAAKDSSQARKLYTFTATQPVRYLSFVVSRFVRADARSLALPPRQSPAADLAEGVWYETLDVTVEANPRQTVRGRETGARAADIALFYRSILEDFPYQSLTIALVEKDVPGGHSPPYFAAVNQAPPASPYQWRDDPASFSDYPDFVLAHEVAHQWWGQAVGWRDYHEQWLSEGFSQYFAALYAQRHGGDEVFANLMRQLRKWAIDESDQGPISLGYRLGHIRGDSRIFRAVLYNKSAAVLHMLRRLIGDEAFFGGLRRFYRTSRFRKVGTDNFRAAMELEAGRSLERFFERWIYGAKLPRLKFSYGLDSTTLLLHAEQLGDVFDVPLTVTLQYADGKQTDVVFAVTDRTADLRVPLAGPLRAVDVSKDDGGLFEITKN